MTRTIAMIAVAGIAGSAMGQFAFELRSSGDNINVGDTVTITLSHSGGVVVAFSGGIAADGGSSNDGAWLVAGDNVVNGTSDGAGGQQGMGYVQFPAYNDDASGDVYSYDWTATAEGTFTISLDTPAYLAGQLGDGSGTTIQNPQASVRVNVIPTPASAAVLGLGGLVAARRRR